MKALRGRLQTHSTSGDWGPVAEAFGRKAQLYDAFGEGHPQLARMRAKVRASVEARLIPGARLLEINAGTGADAAYFASRGYTVHATDLSPGMVARIREKIERLGLAGCLSTQKLSFTQLNQVPGEPFDGLLSNLGGVNCSPDLESITRHLPDVLKPGSLVVWVVMPPVCLWELAQVLRGKWPLATRRLQSGGVLANVEGLLVPTYYYTPRQVQKAFGPDFQFVSLQGLAVFTPPADRKDWPGRWPRLYRLLTWLDDRLADRFPFYQWGDFYILTLRYLPGPGPGTRQGR